MISQRIKTELLAVAKAGDKTEYQRMDNGLPMLANLVTVGVVGAGLIKCWNMVGTASASIIGQKIGWLVLMVLGCIVVHGGYGIADNFRRERNTAIAILRSTEKGEGEQS